MLSGCSKSRTCSCKLDQKRVETRTPKSGGSSTSTTVNESSDMSYTHDKIKKDEMRKYYGCYDRTETSSSSYTTSIPVQSVVVIFGTPVTTTVFVPGDVKTDYENVYDCELK